MRNFTKREKYFHTYELRCDIMAEEASQPEEDGISFGEHSWSFGRKVVSVGVCALMVMGFDGWYMLYVMTRCQDLFENSK